jgi:hypothetical protein
MNKESLLNKIKEIKSKLRITWRDISVVTRCSSFNCGRVRALDLSYKSLRDSLNLMRAVEKVCNASNDGSRCAKINGCENIERLRDFVGLKSKCYIDEIGSDILISW